MLTFRLSTKSAETLFFLQQHEGHNIYSHLSPAEYKTVLGYMKECILATDLALFFGNKSKLKELMDKDQFSWDNQDHR